MDTHNTSHRQALKDAFEAFINLLPLNGTEQAKLALTPLVYDALESSACIDPSSDTKSNPGAEFYWHKGSKRILVCRVEYDAEVPAVPAVNPFTTEERFRAYIEKQNLPGQPKFSRVAMGELKIDVPTDMTHEVTITINPKVAQ